MQSLSLFMKKESVKLRQQDEKRRKEAIRERAKHGAFGYTIVPDKWYQAIENWWHERYHFQMDKEWIIFCTGVVPAISSIVRKMTTAAEKIVLLTPVYNIFFNSVVNNGRYVVECQLQL